MIVEAAGGSETRVNICVMDVENCGLLSVSDEMVQFAVVPAGLILLIFPCFLC